MIEERSEKLITISALSVAGIYGYRRVVSPVSNPTIENISGVAPTIPPLGTFVTSWAVVFLICSIMAAGDPGFGAAFAILIATSYFLANAPTLADSLSKSEGATPADQKVGVGLKDLGTATSQGLAQQLTGGK